MKKSILGLFLLMSFTGILNAADVTSLRVNHLNHPIGITDQHPLFSWILTSTLRNNVQTAYQLEVRKGNTIIWATGKILSEISTGVPYSGKELESATLYTWRVRVWDRKGVSKWVQGSFVTGLFKTNEWKAKWIEPVDTNAQKGSPAPIMRKEFQVNKNIKSAFAFITSHGVNEPYLNGEKIGSYHMAPGWTAYYKRLQYYTYDITSMLKKGTNAFGIQVGCGWTLSRLVWQTNFPYKKLTESTGALAQIIITYTDGTQETICTDKTWKYSTGAVQEATIYDGETIDATKAQPGWNTAGFDDSKWEFVKEATYDNSNLVSCENEPIETRTIRKPEKLIVTPNGEKVIDFGQNLVGYEIATLKGKKGQKVTITHAEVLDENGNFYTRNLRSAKATSTYILSGKTDRFEPDMTFYGFRYIKVEGMEDVKLEDYQAAVIYSSFDDNGDFTCSDDTINQLQSNIRWGMHGNYLDIPTDCPQRDERLGWMGDAQVFFRTATFNGRVHNFFIKWTKDFTAEQAEDGRVPNFVPNASSVDDSGRTGWADAATIIPWQHYQAYGDKRILENQYASMKKWVDYMIKESKDYLWNTGWHYGDWLFYSVQDDRSGESAVTSRRLIQQAFFANSTDIVAKSAEILGYSSDAKKYAEIYQKVKQVFQDNYMTKTGNLMSDTQTAYVLALHFNLLPEEMRPVAAKRLVELVDQYGHLTTGFLGTPYICDVLTENGYADKAYQLLLYKSYPGWLYPVKMGATTIWERWNSMMPDRTIPDNGMNSFNHYSYGAIGDWLYRDAVGIQETSPGFKTIRICPHIGGGLSFMNAHENTPYGYLSAGWKTDENTITVEVTIPVNTTAEIYIPTSDSSTVQENGQSISAESAKGYALVKVGSGTYTFTAKK